MALDCSPENLRRETEAAIAYRAKLTDLSAERDLERNGSDFMEGVTPEMESHDNAADEWMGNVLPQLVYYNPKCSVTSSRPIVQAGIVESIELGLNAWIKKSDLASKLVSLAEDMGIVYGVALVVMGQMPGYEDVGQKPLFPEVVVLKPDWFFTDPQAHGKDDWRFRGHYLIRDKDDLVAELDDQGMPKYDAELIDKLTGDSGPEELTKKELVAGVDRVPRNSIVLYEIYVPETGMIYTLAWGAGEAAYLCPPRKAFVPPGGPYVIFGVHKARNSPFPLAPLAVTAGAAREINAHVDQAVRQADRCKQMTFVDAAADKLKEIIINGKDGEVYGIPGAHDSNIVKVTVDGPDEDTLKWIEMRRADMQKKSGISNPQAGQVTGATATEINTVTSGMSLRLKFMQRQFRSCVMELLNKVVWYLCKSNNVIFWVPQDPESVANGQEEPADFQFMGGQQEGDGDFDPSDLQLDIEPYSMEIEDEAQMRQKAQTAFALLLQAAPVIPTTPFLNWPLLLEDTLKKFGVVDGRKYLNAAMLQQMSPVPVFQPGSPPAPAPGQDTPAPSPLNFATPNKPPTMPSGPATDMNLNNLMKQGSAA